MFTTSALRFVPEIHDYLNGLGKERPAQSVALRGSNTYEIYAVHAFEPMVMLLGHGAESISYFGRGGYHHITVKYPDNRIGAFTLFEPTSMIDDKWYAHPFEASVQFEGGAISLRFTCDYMFRDLADSMCEFFNGADRPAPFSDTLEIMALIEAGAKALKSPETWIKIARS